MGMNVGKEVARLRRMTVAELRGKYAEVGPIRQHGS